MLYKCPLVGNDKAVFVNVVVVNKIYFVVFLLSVENIGNVDAILQIIRKNGILSSSF